MKNFNRKSIGAFILIYIAFYYCVILFADPNMRITMFAQNIISTTGSLIAAIWLLNRYLKNENKKDYFWLLLTVGAVNYFIAELCWMYYECFLQVDVPYPGVPDFFYILQIVFYLIAVGYYFFTTKTQHQLFQWIFEVLIIMVSASTLSYYFIIKRVIIDQEVTGLYLFISLGYPIGDLILFLSALILYFDSCFSRKKNSMFFILLGLLSQVVADSGYVYLMMRERYETGSLFDPLFTVALLTVGYSSFYPKEVKRQNDPGVPLARGNVKASLWKHIVLYGSFIGILVMFYLIEEIEYSTFTLAKLLIVLLIVLRQIIVLYENNHLLNEYDLQNKQLVLSTQRYISLYKYHPDAVFSLSLEGVFHNVNASCTKIIGRKAINLVGKSIYEFISEEDFVRVKGHFSKVKYEPQIFETRIKNGLGDHTYILVTLVPIVIDEETTGIFGIGKDITEMKMKNDKINFMAFHDLLTGLPNRAAFEEILEKAIEGARIEKQLLAVMYIDLDRFKNINDTLGHDAGDELLIDMSKRLVKCVGDKGIIARQGGDEFTLLFNTLENYEEITHLVEQVWSVLSLPYKIREYEFLATPSIGISIFEHEQEETAISLMKKADLAMYKAKHNGKNQYRFFEPWMEEDSRSKFVLGSDLSKAIHNNELILYYQPQFDTKNNRIYGVEALIRWNHPKFGLLYPGDFISIAEDTDHIIPIGEWILRQACLQGKAWGETLKISVNISPKQFQSAHLIETIKCVLDETRMNPALLDLEITEAVAMSSLKETKNKLEAIRQLGVNLSIDDFGTGYSSLSYLPKLPIAALKIPREFLVEMESQPAYKAVLQTIITLGKQLNIDVIAEGVETLEQKRMLEKMGCHLMQGYYYSRPIPVHEFEKILYPTESEAQ